MYLKSANIEVPSRVQILEPYMSVIQVDLPKSTSCHFDHFKAGPSDG